MNCFSFKNLRNHQSSSFYTPSPVMAQVDSALPVPPSTLRRTKRVFDFTPIDKPPACENDGAHAYLEAPRPLRPISSGQPSAFTPPVLQNEAHLLDLCPDKFYVKKVITNEAPPVYLVFEKKIRIQPEVVPSNPRAQFFIGQHSVTKRVIARYK